MLRDAVCRGKADKRGWRSWQIGAIALLLGAAASCGRTEEDRGVESGGPDAAGGAGGVSGTAGNAGDAGGTDGSAGAPDGGIDAAVVGPGAWPDSPTQACTAGSPCPQPGELSFGQDGNYNITPPSYTATDKLVLDAVTGLRWQSSAFAGAWAAAKTHCEDLIFDGHGEWRLPSLIELISLLDYGQDYVSPDSFKLAGTTDGIWTRTRDQIEPSQAWTIKIRGSIQRTNPNESQNAFCVSGPAPVGSFVVSANGLSVVHTMTGLTWQRGTAPAPLSWHEALAYCESLKLAGKDDWRLPNVKELWTLFDDSSTSALIDLGVFPSGGVLQFWSSSPALYANFNNGEPVLVSFIANFKDGALLSFPHFPAEDWSVAEYAPGSESLAARCVRGGN